MSQYINLQGGSNPSTPDLYTNYTNNTNSYTRYPNEHIQDLQGLTPIRNIYYNYIGMETPQQVASTSTQEQNRGIPGTPPPH